MPSPPALSSFLPQLELSPNDDAMLQDLAATLVASNLEQCSVLALAQDRRRWKELHVDHSSREASRKAGKDLNPTHCNADSLRAFEERDTAKQPLLIPSLVLAGTVVGSVDDILLGYTPPIVTPGRLTAEQAMQVKTRCVQDGAVDFKLLRTVVAPTARFPLRHVSVVWRRFETADFVTLDATGVVTSSSGDLVAYSLSHSVDFAQLSSFERNGVDRGNVSVCSLFRQKSSNQVAVYVRGFFDLITDRHKDKHVYQVELRAASSRWMKVLHHLEFAHMRKLRWKLQVVHGPLSSSRSSENAALDAVKPRGKHRQNCTACGKSAGFLVSRRRCALCRRPVCSACLVKRSLFDLSDPVSGAVSEHKKTFCLPCDRKASRSDARTVACDETDRNLPMTNKSSASSSGRSSSFRLSTRSRQSFRGDGIFI